MPLRIRPRGGAVAAAMRRASSRVDGMRCRLPVRVSSRARFSTITSSVRRVAATSAALAPRTATSLTKFPNLTRALLEKGYTPEDIRKIYGENFLRVMRAVEAAAAK